MPHNNKKSQDMQKNPEQEIQSKKMISFEKLSPHKLTEEFIKDLRQDLKLYYTSIGKIFLQRQRGRLLVEFRQIKDFNFVKKIDPQSPKMQELRLKGATISEVQVSLQDYYLLINAKTNDQLNKISSQIKQVKHQIKKEEEIKMKISSERQQQLIQIQKAKKKREQQAKEIQQEKKKREQQTKEIQQAKRKREQQAKEIQQANKKREENQTQEVPQHLLTQKQNKKPPQPEISFKKNKQEEQGNPDEQSENKQSNSKQEKQGSAEKVSESKPEGDGKQEPRKGQNKKECNADQQPKQKREECDKQSRSKKVEEEGNKINNISYEYNFSDTEHEQMEKSDDGSETTNSSSMLKAGIIAVVKFGKSWWFS